MEVGTRYCYHRRRFFYFGGLRPVGMLHETQRASGTDETVPAYAMGCFDHLVRPGTKYLLRFCYRMASDDRSSLL